MRVLLITNDYPPKPGGIQQYLGNIVARHEGPIRVLAPRHPGAPSDPVVVRGSATWMTPTPGVRRWVRENLVAFEPDVMVFGAPHPLAQLGPGLRRQTGVPYVVMTHGAEVTVPAIVPGLRQALSWTFRRADGIFAVSRYTARRVQKLGGGNLTVLGAGVDLDAFHPAPAARNGPIVIGCTSRFIPRKGHLRVIEAAEVLSAAGLPIEVLIVGKGRLESQIRARAARASIPVRVEVDVPWERLPELYREMSVFVMPARSRWAGLEVEGLGIVYLEAAATGLPVVAGPSGGSPETVVPGQTGFVAAEVAEIVEAVLAITQSGHVYGEANRRRAEAQFSWESVMELWVKGLEAATAREGI